VGVCRAGRDAEADGDLRERVVPAQMDRADQAGQAALVRPEVEPRVPHRIVPRERRSQVRSGLDTPRFQVIHTSCRAGIDSLEGDRLCAGKLGTTRLNAGDRFHQMHPLGRATTAIPNTPMNVVLPPTIRS
jgi:hypothetical protein